MVPLRGVGLVSLSWKSMRWRSRALNTSSCEGARRIVKSPPLLSLDFPDDWVPFSDSREILKSPPLLSLDVRDVWAPIADSRESSSVSNGTNQHTAVIIDGKAIAAEITSRITSEVRSMGKYIGKVPGLAVILVGQRKECQTYARNKIMACEEAGFKSSITEFPEDCTEDDVISALSSFNHNPSIHGIIVQLPLPQHLDQGKILSMLCLEKDVDGLHPLNIGYLAMRGREPLFISCTPKGCIELLLRSGVEIMGKKAVVIGRSNIVGLPTSLLLQRHHATVSVLHAFTQNPEKISREADIVITAVGIPNLVRGSWLKSGAVVIDVGTCPVECEWCQPSSPVPGGVGPMTIAMLLLNTLESAKRAYNREDKFNQANNLHTVVGFLVLVSRLAKWSSSDWVSLLH
ncbi:hypothetical protein Ancab_035935 [Ancistrocladus abbreviatus]